MKTWLRSRLVLAAAFFAVAAPITYACKDFLNTPSQGTVEVETLLTHAGVEGSLIAAYRVLDCTNSTGAWGCSASNWIFGDVTSDDAYKGSEASDQPSITQVELYNWGTGQAGDDFNSKWSTVYEGVVRANGTLRLLARVRAEKPGEISDGDAAAIRGEATFLRAHYHFEAYRMWGKIPYYHENDTDPTTGRAFVLPNNLAPDSVAGLIMADLDTAIALLGDGPRNGDAGRASKWTAKAYKGRVQVYRGQYAAAITTLNDVVNNGPYDLESSFDHVWTGFSSFANGAETIWAYEASSNDGEPNGQNANWGETLNFPHSGSPFGCCGFHQPSQNLANFYAVDGLTGLPKAYTSPATWNNRDSTWVAAVTDTVDPRLDWTVGRDNVPYKDWGLHRAGWIRAPAYGGRYSPKKNAHENASGSQSQVGWNSAQLNSVHVHLFRYADMLLLLAEAEVEANGATGLVNARNIVNQIRARAAVTAQGCGGGVDFKAESTLVARYPGCAGDTRLAVPINDASIAWATYEVGQYPAFATQAEARTAVRIERRLELGMEGQRFFDLRRWGEPFATQTINDYLTEERTRRSYKTQQLLFASRNMFFPIPPIQIDLSKVGTQSMLTQNTGW
jgi:starch-binding outer membrane protein, SusD/RagB family